MSWWSDVSGIVSRIVPVMLPIFHEISWWIKWRFPNMVAQNPPSAVKQHGCGMIWDFGINLVYHFGSHTSSLSDTLPSRPFPRLRFVLGRAPSAQLAGREPSTFQDLHPQPSTTWAFKLTSKKHEKCQRNRSKWYESQSSKKMPAIQNIEMNRSKWVLWANNWQWESSKHCYVPRNPK